MSQVALPGTVPPRTAADTTAGAAWTPVRVEAVMAEPALNLDANPLHLDGPAAWGAYLARAEAHGTTDLPPLSGRAVDFALPLAVWTRPAPAAGLQAEVYAADGTSVWGWACSAAHYTPAGYTVVEVRRKPATEAMAALSDARKHHLALGPMKAKNVAEPATIAPLLTWWALADPGPLQVLLARVAYVGRMVRHGNGRVLHWRVTPDEAARAGWTRRQFPDPGGQPGTIRAPYHHRSRRMPCTAPPDGAAAWA